MLCHGSLQNQPLLSWMVNEQDLWIVFDSGLGERFGWFWILLDSFRPGRRFVVFDSAKRRLIASCCDERFSFAPTKSQVKIRPVQYIR